MKKQDILLLTGLMLVLILVRVIFNIPNFNPIGAIALMGGVLFRKNSLAFSIPLGALFMGDLLLAFSSPAYAEYLFSQTFIFVYISFIVIILLGKQISTQITLTKVFGGSIASAVLFFLITNAGSWLSLNYEPNFNGLILAYEAGIPFFRASLLSQIIFSVGIFVVYNFASRKKIILA
jgi:hypothetical protein